MSDLDSLFNDLLLGQQSKKLPPIHKWQPTEKGEIDIEIKDDGLWYHEKREIKRKEIVRLFASILLKEKNSYFLVTPVQKLKIEVNDAPFIAINMEAKGKLPSTDLLFETNVGDYVLLDKDHPIWMVGEKPYIHVRNGLNALLTRSAFYRLIDYAIEKNDQLWVKSSGESFTLGPIN